MKISEKQLLMLLQIAVDSVKADDGHFRYSEDHRNDLVTNIMAQQSTELVDIEEDTPTLKPYNELKEAVKLLREWRRGTSDGGGQFTLSTKTIKFLDNYDS